MSAWLYQNWSTLIILVLLMPLIGYVVWLRMTIKYSKARFALATLAAIIFCLLAFFTLLNSSVPIIFLNMLFKLIGEMVGWVPKPIEYSSLSTLHTSVAFIVTFVAMLFIFRFARQVVKTWPGEPTVAVNDLAKEHLDNSIFALARVEVSRLLARNTDPLASECAINWQNKFSEAPPKPDWKELSKQLFEAKFPEAVFPDKNAWRATSNAWVGQIYLEASMETTGLLLLVLDKQRSVDFIKERMAGLRKYLSSDKSEKIYVVFNSEEVVRTQKLKIDGYDLEVWSKKELLRSGLELQHYARDLVRQFDEAIVAETGAVLKDCFVPAHVSKSCGESNIELYKVLTHWVMDPTRRHLAITGEYGQGKSTAMLEFCANWARRYLQGLAVNDKVPLLIELRGQDPAGTNHLAFISSWAGRYHLSPDQILNLIEAGDAILIFEGFDELRNAGREFDRHEHFNALWRFAYPGTKLIFTGRPNFFLDENEKNRTLRSDPMRRATDNAYTELWELDRLTLYEIEMVCRAFGGVLCQSIVKAARVHQGFFEIVSRPSMIPVVATIWPTIQSLQDEGYDLTGALLIEHYLQAVYLRKEKEIEEDRVSGAPEAASYLSLPREVREALTLAIVWKMARLDSRNTISRVDFNSVIASSFEAVFTSFKSKDVPPDIVKPMLRFEERYKEETRGEHIERITNEIATAGVFVSDPVGGSGNLRLPHKQYYEYLIAKAFWTVCARPKSLVASVIKANDSGSSFENLLKEKGSIKYVADILGDNLSLFKSFQSMFSLRYMYIFSRIFLKNNNILAKTLPKNLIYNFLDITIGSLEVIESNDNTAIGRRLMVSTFGLVSMTGGIAGAISVITFKDLGLDEGLKFSIMLGFVLGHVLFITIWFQAKFGFPSNIVLMEVVRLKLVNEGVDTNSDKLKMPIIWKECITFLNGGFEGSKQSQNNLHSKNRNIDPLLDLIEPIV